MEDTNQNIEETSLPIVEIFNSQILHSPTGLIILFSLVLIGIIQYFSGSQSKGEIATSYWGGSKEKRTAAKKAKKQIAKPQRNSVSLYIGTPWEIRSSLEAEWYESGLIKAKTSKLNKIFSPSSTLYVPDAQRGISVIGAPGSGKTYSVIDPLIRSALDQKFSTIVYDFKYPAQAKRIFAYAAKRGYKVHVFAPGFPESETCNPLDLLKDEEDAVSAGQLTKTISRNFDRGGAGDNKFFEDAGESLLEGILLVTKAVGSLIGDDKYCDLMMAQAILSLPSLPKRLEIASKGKLKVWTSRPLSQLISVKDSEKTTAAIIGVAQRMFQRFLKRDFIGAFCGKTTLPLDLDGKQLIIFGLDRNNRDIVSPLLAAILNIIVSRNVSRVVPRKDPLVVALDEIPTIVFPDLVKLLNENREDGFVGILGFQNIAQLEKAYSQELARAILGGTATKFIFNPQEERSAELFSKYLGDIEIKLKPLSRTFGKFNSRSTSEQYQKRRLIELSQLVKMGTGKALIVNSNYKQGDEAYIPLLEKIKVPSHDIAQMNFSENKWDFILQRLIKKNKDMVTESERARQFNERLQLAEKLFPLPSPPD